MKKNLKQPIQYHTKKTEKKKNNQQKINCQNGHYHLDNTAVIILSNVPDIPDKHEYFIVQYIVLLFS